MPTDLDAADRRLLDVLQDDNRLSAERIAERIGSSRSAVQRRLARLRAAGVIAGDVAVLDADAVGGLMTFVVDVELERERIDLLDDFRRSVLAIDEVQQCYYVTGRSDFALVITARDMNAYEALTRRLFTENPNIRRFATSVVVDRVKVGMKVPLSQEE